METQFRKLQEKMGKIIEKNNKVWCEHNSLYMQLLPFEITIYT